MTKHRWAILFAALSASVVLIGCNQTISKDDPHQKDNLANKEKAAGAAAEITTTPPPPPKK